MRSKLVQTENLSIIERNAMYSLLSSHFDGVRQDVFDSDLSNKNWVILLADENGAKLQGFSTLQIYQTQYQEEKINIVFSGDTIVDPSAWSSSSLSRTWISSVKKLRSQYSQGKLYWLLISGGFRTYRFLPIFWQEFYPRYDAVTPEKTAALMQFLATQRFGKYYNAKTGVVCFPHPHILRNKLQGIPPERIQDSHINFFALQNPGHLKGEELVCLTEISEKNLTRAGRRMWFANEGMGNGERGMGNKMLTEIC